MSCCLRVFSFSYSRRYPETKHGERSRDAFVTIIYIVCQCTRYIYLHHCASIKTFVQSWASHLFLKLSSLRSLLSHRPCFLITSGPLSNMPPITSLANKSPLRPPPLILNHMSHATIKREPHMEIRHFLRKCLPESLLAIPRLAH